MKVHSFSGALEFLAHYLSLNLLLTLTSSTWVSEVALEPLLTEMASSGPGAQTAMESWAWGTLNPDLTLSQSLTWRISLSRRLPAVVLLPLQSGKQEIQLTCKRGIRISSLSRAIKSLKLICLISMSTSGPPRGSHVMSKVLTLISAIPMPYPGVTLQLTL